MFENIIKLFKKVNKKETQNSKSKEAAKERLHLVLMQDRANVSADFLDLMRQEIIEVIKKYIDIDESSMDVRLTNQANEDGTQGAPALYANIPILNIKDETRNIKKEIDKKEQVELNKGEEDKDNTTKENNFVESKEENIEESVVEEKNDDATSVEAENDNVKESEKDRREKNTESVQSEEKNN